MKILVLSFYFQPDLCAGSFRATALVKELEEKVPEGSVICVVTTLPNRYRTFSAEASQIEKRGTATIYRVALPAHQSGMIDQSKAFLVFARETLHLIKDYDFDAVFATSSRLMTAVLGAWIARRKRAKLYLDIRDVFVDTISYVIPRYIALLAKPIFSFFERWAFNYATNINLVSQGFTNYFSKRYPHHRFTYFTNGIDDEFMVASSSISSRLKLPRPVKVLYAGNIGEGQGLHLIIPKLARSMRGQVAFKIIGEGGRKEALRIALHEAGVDNVALLAPLTRDHLIKSYQEADVLFLHLNEYDAFKKVLPSKIFEYAAMGKPIWAGVSGYAADFIYSEVENAAVFSPCDISQAEQAFSRLVLCDMPRHGFIKKFRRKNIMKAMAEDMLLIMQNKKNF